MAGQPDKPDFTGLVQYLLEPFLDHPDSLRIDCEMNAARSRAWVRVAFKEEERGRVFGRGGRNIQAIRTVVQAAGKLAGWTVHLDVFGAPQEGSAEPRRSPSRRSDRVPKPRPRPASHE